MNPHLQPGALFEVRLAAQTTDDDTHRAQHGEADKAPARVSEPSAGEREAENVQKRRGEKKKSKLSTTNIRKKECRSRL